MGILGNTRSSYRRNEGMIAAERYIIRHFQINRSAFCYSPSLIAVTQLWFKIQPVHGSCYSSKHTMFDWSLWGNTCWPTDRDVSYSLCVLNRKMSCDSDRGWAERERDREREREERHRLKLFINRLITLQCPYCLVDRWFLLLQFWLTGTETQVLIPLWSLGMSRSDIDIEYRSDNSKKNEYRIISACI